MKYYKDTSNNVYGVDEGQDVKSGWTEIQDYDIPSIVGLKKTKEEKDKEVEDAEWNEYLVSENEAKRTAWKLAGKPKYKGN